MSGQEHIEHASSTRAVADMVQLDARARYDWENLRHAVTAVEVACLSKPSSHQMKRHYRTPLVQEAPD